MPQAHGSGRARALLLAGVGILLLVSAACGSDDSSGSGSTTSTPTTAAATVSGDVVVNGAASLTKAFEAAEPTLEGDNPGLDVMYDFGSSSDLAAQIIAGSPADVFASADEKQMQRVVDEGLAVEPAAFATNRLMIAVAPGNPLGISSLADLDQAAGASNEDEHVKIGLAAPKVPARTYADQMFEQEGLTVAPDATGPDVTATLQLVISGQVDAAIVYVTDVKSAGDDVVGVPIPDDQNVIATYVIAALVDAPHPEAATAFVESALTGAVADSLRTFGFGEP